MRRLFGFVSLLTIGLLTQWVPANTHASAAPRSIDQVPAGVPAGAKAAKATDYIDGDKFKVTVDGKPFDLNLLGTDAPEMGSNDIFKPFECYAQEAADRVKKLVKHGTTLYLESDKDDQDDKGRLLRYVWVPGKGTKPAFMLNSRLLGEGYASFKDDDPNTNHNDELKKAEAGAKARRAGLWGTCSGPHVKLKAVGVADNPAPVGRAIAANDEEVAVAGVSFVDSYDFLVPTAGNVLMVLDVTVHNQNATDKRDFNEFCFGARDIDNNFTFRPGLNPSGTPLHSGELNPGETAQGQVVIEVRANSQRIRVEYGGYCTRDSLYWLVTPQQGG